jgi:aspartate kinase
VGSKESTMLVMKFGGTSVGSASRFRQVLELVQRNRQAGERPVVVLSAVAGVTNGLIECGQLSVKRNLPAALEQLAKLKDKHLEVIRDLFATSPPPDLMTELDAAFGQIDILLRGVSYLGELSKRSLDAVSGFGELLSSRIFAAYANLNGLPAEWMDARQFLITDDTFGRANPDWPAIVPKTKALLTPILEKKGCVVTQGFIGSTADGVSTTLGRGGSDFSASIIGVALDASEIQIWTDVDGMMSADPRLVPDATVLDQVSFQEASELAYFGAKVLHPLTIKPAVEKNIPVRILNTTKPDRKGTLITETPAKNDATICSIASKKGLTAVFIHSPRMLMAHGFLAKVFDIFARYETAIDLIATSEVSVSLTIDSTDELERIKDALSELGDVSVMHRVAIVTVVGRQFRQQSGIAGQIFSALSKINIIMISGGASDINVSCVVNEVDADKAVTQLHHEFFPAVITA